MKTICSVRLNDRGDELIILDQTLLPNETKYIKLKDPHSIFNAIYELKVRGAPAIGIAAAYGAYLGVLHFNAADYNQLYAKFLKIKKYLASSRPTAVNLFWALNRLDHRIQVEKDKSVPDIKQALKEEADAIAAEDEKVCRSIGENALTLLKDGMGILTHCNAGTIATASYGTALAPLYLGAERGYTFRVFADESRPLLQGARLTTWELMQAGIDVTLICDGMASIVMEQGWVNAVIVGCDRIAVNGDTANKIGTSGVAILARYYGIPFYVAAPISTIDMSCPTGKEITIEKRPSEEVTRKWYAKPIAPEGVKVYNPAFDVTDHQLITAIITEKGIIYPPYRESLPRLFV